MRLILCVVAEKKRRKALAGREPFDPFRIGRFLWLSFPVLLLTLSFRPFLWRFETWRNINRWNFDALVFR